MCSLYKYLLPFIVLGLYLALPVHGWAAVAISEVMWAGTDLSSSDEWMEIVATTDTDLSGATVTYMKSSGEETVITTFGSWFTVAAGEVFVLSHYHGDASRLAAEPRIVATQVVLPNTKLILRIRDQSGAILDEVNAGTSSPFAGLNPSGGLGRASMERIDPSVDGSDPLNWVTATRSLGFDEGSVVFGTPGFPYSPPASSSSSSSSSDSSDSSVSSVSSSPPCSDTSVFALDIQSGTPEGISKVSINMQVIALSGSLTHATCHWMFGDGETSESCNPPSHTYDTEGTYAAIVDVSNRCGISSTLTQPIAVHPDPAASFSSSSSVAYDGARIVISAAMPNARGADTALEWIELRNLETRSVSLSGFMFGINGKRFPIRGSSSIGPGAVLRLYRPESGLELPNTHGTLELISPVGVVLSTIEYEKAAEVQIVKPSAFRSEELMGMVSEAKDGDTVEILLDVRSRQLLPEERVTVRFLGIDAPELTPPEPFAKESRALLESLVAGQEVTLSFDADVWDAFGRLLAYVELADGRSVEREVLRQGLAEAIRVFPYRRKEEYIALEEEAMRLKRGLWAASNDLPARTISGGLLSPATVAPLFPFGGPCDIAITEVYPSPPVSAGSGSLLATHEWFELQNRDSFPIGLSGATVTVGKRKIVLGAGFRVGSGALMVVDLSPYGMHLPNDGGTIGLRSHDGQCDLALTYPKVPSGASFIAAANGERCVSSSPSPGRMAECPDTGTAGSKATKTSAARKPRKSVYDTYARNYVADAKEFSSLQPMRFEERSSAGQLAAVAVLAAIGGGAGTMLVMRVRRRKG